MTSRAIAPVPSLTDRLRRFVESAPFQRFIVAVILVNAVTLGLETSDAAMRAFGPVLVALDRIALAIFVAELVLKLVAYRLRFFANGWNLFDFAVVGVSLLPATGNLSVLRALRVLRVLRLVSALPNLRRVVQGLLSALPGMGSIGLVLALIYYVSGVLATKLFGDAFPEWFGTLGRSVYSLFQVMTLESWSMGIVRPVMEVYPWAWAFFVPYIVITTFAALNLVIAVIVNSIQNVQEAEKADAAKDLPKPEAPVDDLAALRRDMAEIKALLAGRTER